MAEQDKFEAMEVKTKKQAEEAERRKKAKKRNYIVGLSLLGAGLVGLVAVYVLAAQVWLVDLSTLPYIEYSYSSKAGTTTATLTRVKDNSNYPEHFRVPEKVNGLTVTAIGDDAFAGCFDISSVTMPDTITSIGNYAFAGLEGLETISFSKNITHLGTDAFKDTAFLNNLPDDEVSVISKILFHVGEDQLKENTVLLADHNSKVPAKYSDPKYNVTYISDFGKDNEIAGWGEGLFANNSKIVYAEIPGYLEEVPTNSFLNAKNLEGISFNGETKEIKSKAFVNTSKLENVKLSENVTTIGDNAFENSGIKNLELTNNVTKLGKAVFKGCKNIETFNWPSHLDIPNETFANCEKLTTVNIDQEGYNNIASIGRGAFKNTAISEFYVPKNVSSLSMSLFEGDESLTSVYLYKGNKDYDRSGKIVTTGVKTIDSQAFQDTSLKEIRLVDESKTPITPANELSFPISFDIFTESGSTGETFAGSQISSFTFPSSVKSTTYAMFKNCKNLSEVKFEQRHLGPKMVGLEQIGMQTFAGCDSLVNVVLPETIKTIGAGAFNNMAGLKEISLPNGESTYAIIESNMFENDQNLERVNISDKVYLIKEKAFLNNFNLENIYLSYDKDPKKFSADRGAIDNMRQIPTDSEGNLIPLKEEEKMPIFVSFKYEDVSSRYLPNPVYNSKGEIAKKGWYDKTTCHVFWKGDWELVDGKPTPTDYTIRDEVKEAA